VSGGRSDLSERGASPEHAARTDELKAALDSLRTRLHDITEWAERASIPPAAPPGGSSEPAGAAAGETIAHQEPPAPSGKVGRSIRELADTGAIAGGVVASGGDVVQLGVIELGALERAEQVPITGMLALLDLVPPETVLEVRTTVAEWRAARVGDEAFVVELRDGFAERVDELLATLLPSEKD
jgi:hypothetical protein